MANPIIDLTESVSTLTGKVDEGFSNIKDRLSSLESKPPPAHSCLHEEEIRNIPAIREKAQNVSKWLAALVTIMTVVGGGAIGFAISASSKSSETSTRVDGLSKTVNRHEEVLSDLDDELSDTREAIILQVEKGNRQIRRTIIEEKKNGEHVIEVRADRVKKLRPYDRRQFKRLLLELENSE